MKRRGVAGCVGYLTGCGDGRLQIRHDDRPFEVLCGLGHHRLKRRPVPDVQVPVIRPSDGEAVCCYASHPCLYCETVAGSVPRL